MDTSNDWLRNRIRAAFSCIFRHIPQNRGILNVSNNANAPNRGALFLAAINSNDKDCAKNVYEYMASQKTSLCSAVNNELLRHLKYPEDYVICDDKGRCLLDFCIDDGSYAARDGLMLAELTRSYLLDQALKEAAENGYLYTKVNSEGDSVFMYWARRICSGSLAEGKLFEFVKLYFKYGPENKGISFKIKNFNYDYTNKNGETVFTIIGPHMEKTDFKRVLSTNVVNFLARHKRT